ncbi:MAG: class I SAM-dependent methyltransferase [Tissierellia bacterium]|nr:class I SAM-dependent methyltransferase [Tissierellia bacterium]
MDDNTIQDSLLFPLIGRFVCNRKWPRIFRDNHADYLIRKLEINVGAKEYGTVSNLLLGFRHMINTVAARCYIKKHPNAHIINMGCGLDTIFDNIDNGKIRYYNLDSADIIALRNKYFELSERETDLPFTIMNFKWMDEVDFKEEDGALFLAAGAFNYLKEEDIKRIVDRLSEEFPGCQLSFDVKSSAIVRNKIKKARKHELTGAKMQLKLEDPLSIKNWNNGIKRVHVIKDFSCGLIRNDAFPLWLKCIVFVINKMRLLYQVIIDFE